jgi:SH3 domain-containing YSC84-like protein 1
MRWKQARKYCLTMVCTFVLTYATMGWAQNSNDKSDIQKRLDASADVINQIMGTDKSIPDKIMSSADCIAVVPSLVKVAFVFGGRHGKGVATCRTANGWSAPAPITVTGGSWGLQIGAQAVDLVMLVMNEKGMDQLLTSKFNVGAGAAAAAGPVGREGSANTDWKMKSEILTYSRSRGVFAGIDLSGASITQDKDETRILYGKMVPFSDLLRGRVPPPQGSQTFMAAVKRYSREAKQTGSLHSPAPVGATASE